MIYARSSRPTLAMALGSLAVGLLLAAAAGGTVLNQPGDWAALYLALASSVPLAFAVRSLLRLRRWPPARLGLFRDRLVVVQGRTEMRALWDGIELVSLADQSEWGAQRWPEISLTDRLTLRLRKERPFSFRPAAFGLRPIDCRDMILRLRDSRELRLQLPEFDSVLDLAARERR